MNFLMPFDMLVLTTLAAHQTYDWVIAGIIVSELGRATTVLLLTLALALYLGLHKRFALAQGLVLAVATSGIVTFLLKGFIARPRPPEQYWAYHEVWYAFPSEHAALSAALYGFAAYIALQFISGRLRRKLLIIGATTLVLLIGFTRLYLGVHYLSDVLGGYAVGLASIWLGVWASRSLSRPRTK